MSKRVALVIGSLLLVLGIASCQKLETTRSKSVAPPFEAVNSVAALPAEYGNLVGVTSHPSNPYWVSLWFVKEDKTILAVRVNQSTGEIYSRVLTIPRR